MSYFWIFVGCYASAFVVMNLRLAAQWANIEMVTERNGGDLQQLKAIYRADFPLYKDIAIRLWASLVFASIPTVVISLVYWAL